MNDRGGFPPIAEMGHFIPVLLDRQNWIDRERVYWEAQQQEEDELPAYPASLKHTFIWIDEAKNRNMMMSWPFTSVLNDLTWS